MFVRTGRSCRTARREIGSGGAYHDQMVKLGGRWLFRYRKIDRFIAA
jgi:hypothetical protein